MNDQAKQNPDEPWPDQIDRLREMADPRSDWDLSDNDRAAISAILKRLHAWKSLCVIEVACDNPSVDSYMREWEGRALKAEAQLAAQARTLETLRAENERLTRVGQSCGAMADQRTAQLLEAKTALAEARAEMDRLRQLVDACIRGPRSPVEPT